MRLVPLLLLVLPLGAASCDPELLGGAATDAARPAKLEAEAEAEAEAKAEPEAATRGLADAKKADDDEYAACIAGCNEGRAQSPTDQATCRLSCGARGPARFSPGTSRSTKTALARFEACVESDCGAPASATNSTTCRLTCVGAALSGPGAPTLPSTARECASQCLAALGDCGVACRGNRDDVATCKLQCTSLGEHCLGHCEQPMLR